MALFWGGDALAVWSTLAAFGFAMNGAALIVGYCTGMVFTRRIAPLAGAGTPGEAGRGLAPFRLAFSPGPGAAPRRR